MSNVSAGKNDVDGDESSNDELPSLRKLLSSTMQARQSSLKISQPSQTAHNDPMLTKFF